MEKINFNSIRKGETIGKHEVKFQAVKRLLLCIMKHLIELYIPKELCLQLNGS